MAFRQRGGRMRNLEGGREREREKDRSIFRSIERELGGGGETER